MKYIHIAGTNAKGSVSEYIYQILLRAGFKCGVFTSPHLFSPTERMRINGCEINHADYERYMEAAKREDGEHLFRVWTRAALNWFADNEVEAAVIEAGIGGSKDSTNVVNAMIAVITPISLDHTQILGKTVERIARDKCGIIKKGAVVITFGQQKSVLRVIEAECKKRDARLVQLFPYTVHSSGLDGQTFSYRDMERLEISAVSPAQIENACAAAEAALILGISREDVREGLKATSLMARAQIAGPQMMIDGAHNPASILELKRTVEKYFPGKNVLVLTAIMKDKDAAAIASIITTFAAQVVCTCTDRNRGLAAFEYAKHFKNADYFSDAQSAFAYAKSKNPDLLVVCGSFYLAGRILGLTAAAR